MNYKRIIAHIIYWIIFIFIYPVFYNLISANSFEIYLVQVKNLALGVPYIIFASYFITYYLVPVLIIKKKKYIFFVLLYISTFIFITFIDILYTRYYVFPKDYPHLTENHFTFLFRAKHIFRVLFILHSEVFIFIAVRFFIHYLIEYFEKSKVEVKYIESELNLLRGQIHPHFLFNTLNNIYTMSLDCDNGDLSDSISKMSDILRFTLYECNSAHIPLKKEVKIIQDYIDLEKLRYSQLDLEITIPSEIKEFNIIPLVLFTFVENAFKHGASRTIKNKWIKIDLYFENDNLHFTVRNSKNPDNIDNSIKKIKGIGIKNAIKRMELAYPKGNYILNINDSDLFYEVVLVIKNLSNE